MENIDNVAVAEMATMQYLVNAVLNKVELRKDITDSSDRQETVCFNTIVETFGGK
jgi:hypothetical protein